MAFAMRTCVVYVMATVICSAYAATSCPESGISKRANGVVDLIFKKYGSDGYTVIKKEQFKALLKMLKLAKVKVVCLKNDTVCMRKKFEEHMPKRKMVFDPLQPNSKRERRDLSIQQKKIHAIQWKTQLKQCMSVSAISKAYKINASIGITKNDFFQICPALINQIDNDSCIHYHKKYPAIILHEGPTETETWGYGFLAITIVSLLSLAVIAMIPCLKKSFYDVMMAYLVALAVGTLAGDAILHLIPHALIEGANLAGNIEVNESQRLRQHYALVWRGMFILVGIYAFFLVEQLMKFKGACCGTKHGHSHGHEVPATEMDTVPISETATEETVVKVDEPHNHGHSHSDKQITGETKVASVAWMVIVGDGFHNFSDGLAVGAAFSASISSGVGTTVAIFCHELPHELGDFAILLKSGMTVKQAIVYNLVSAILSYVGLVVGIFAGEEELGRHIIICITAGLFLYISLADMMGELTDTGALASKRATFICQHLGLLTGIAVMLVISLYEDKM